MSVVQLVDIGETEQEVFTRWDITGHQVNRHLLSKAITGTDDVVLDHLTFPPGFIHHMHRHPHADVFVIPMSGVVQFLGAPRPSVEVSPGREGTVDSHVLHFFAGVGSVDDIGYEAYPVQGEATASHGNRQGSSACG
jgi:quercetin dioxygenase-like cupin family protein